MLSEQTQPLQSNPRIRPETSAWMILCGFFILFCLIVAGVGYAGWQFYATAQVPVGGTLLRVHTIGSGVLYYPKGSVSGRPPQVRCANGEDYCANLNEGDRVEVVPGAGYGQAATFILGEQAGNTIDLWSHPTGADLTFETYRAYRSDRTHHAIVLLQKAGYARYDIFNDLSEGAPPSALDYTVKLPDGSQIDFELIGSYSINVPRDEAGNPRPLLTGDQSFLAEITVREGRATVRRNYQSLTLEPGQKVQIALNGMIGVPAPAQWQMLADGRFEQEYRRQTGEMLEMPWKSGGEALPGAEAVLADETRGVFTVVKACPPSTPDYCSPDNQTPIGRFRREGGQQQPYMTYVEQALDTDVSEYRSLKLTAWTRVLPQTAPGVGANGTECPITIQLTFKLYQPTDPPESRSFCVYVTDSTNNTPPSADTFTYRAVPPYEWRALEFELRAPGLLQEARYLQAIRISASGRDYLSEITDVSLVASEVPHTP
jgi:hypothetical protein